MNEILNETAGQLITAFNSGRLAEWLEAEALEINAEEKEILLAYGGYTLWVDLKEKALIYHYGNNEARYPLGEELTNLLLNYI